MQTIHCTTARFICRTGNVVDLGEYRRRLERAAAPAAEPALPQGEEERTFVHVRRRTAGVSPGLFLDFCASAAIVVMTVTVVIQFFVP